MPLVLLLWCHWCHCCCTAIQLRYNDLLQQEDFTNPVLIENALSAQLPEVVAGGVQIGYELTHVHAPHTKAHALAPHMNALVIAAVLAP